ncbi:MAG: hypothetical protein CVU00_08865 [Bacteroidetes bacterium HGW-Bacteroidetes-17]|jgi:hypothetical protein|nr:MAG: hypothetical protein CVU00_08865 [Bacteroidetes bacterium HGW-Bacteroidetes-17]
MAFLFNNIECRRQKTEIRRQKTEYENQLLIQHHYHYCDYSHSPKELRKVSYVINRKPFSNLGKAFFMIQR